MAENERIIELSIDEKKFKQQMDSIVNYMSIFENKINNFEKNINNIDLSGKFKNIDKNMSESSKNISKDIFSINNNLDSVANTVNGNVLDSLMSLNNKFTFLGITGLKVINQLSDSFIGFTKNIVKSMTEFENMSAAMSKFEQKNNAIRTIMNSITDDKVPEAYKNQIDGTVKTIDYVTDALSKLETFSDETSYDFTQMTQSIGKLVSMGNSLEKASDTVLGMANWSSLVGKSAKDFESLSYAVEKVAGLGYVGLQQYQMLSTYMDPQTKKNILEQAAALGTLKKVSDDTYKTLSGENVDLQSFSTNLKEKWLTMDVLNGVMGKYSEFSNAVIEYMDETGATASEAIKKLETQYDSVTVKAFKSAQEAKTFGEAIESVQVAVTTGWAKSFEYIFGNVEEASKIFTDLANQLYDIFAIGKYTRNALLKEWSSGGGRDTLFSALLGDEEEINGVRERVGGLLSYIANIVSTIKESIGDVFGFLGDDEDESSIKSYAKSILELTQNFKDFIKSIEPTEEFLNNLKIIIGTLATIIKGFIGIIVSVTKPVLKIISQLLSYLFELSSVISSILYLAINNLQKPFMNFINIIKDILSPAILIIINMFKQLGGYLRTFVISLSGLISPIKQVLNTIVSQLNKMKLEGKFDGIYKALSTMSIYITKWASYVVRAFQLIITDGNVKKIIDIFSNIFSHLSKIVNQLVYIFTNSKIAKTIKAFINAIISPFNKLQYYFNNTNYSNIIGKGLDKIGIAINSGFSIIERKLQTSIRSINIQKYLKQVLGPDTYEIIEKFFNKIKSTFNNKKFPNIGEMFSNFINSIKTKGFIETFKDIFTNLINSLKNINWQNVFSTVFQIVQGAAIVLTELLSKALNNLFNFLKNAFTAKNISEVSNEAFKILGDNLKNIAITLGNILKFILSNVINILKNISPELVKVAPVLITLILFMKKLNQVADIAQTFADAKLKEAEFHNKLAVVLSIVAIAGAIVLISKIPLDGIIKAALTIAAMIAVVNIIPNLVNKFLPVAKEGNAITLASVGGLLIMILAFNALLDGVKGLAKQLAQDPIPTLLALVGILLIINEVGNALSKVNLSGGESGIVVQLDGFFKNISNVLISITAFMKLVNFKSILKSLGVMIISMLAIAGAVTTVNMILSALAKAINAPTISESNKGGGIIGAIFGTVNAASLTKSLVAIQSLTGVIKDLANIPILSLVAALGSFIVVVALVTHFAEPLEKVGTSVLMVSGAFMIFAMALGTLSSKALPNILTLAGLLLAVIAPMLILVGVLKALGIPGESAIALIKAFGEVLKNVALTVLSFGASALMVAGALSIIVGTFDQMDKMSLALFGKMLLLAVGIGAISLALVPLATALKPVVDSLINLLKVIGAFIGKKIDGFLNKDKVKEDAEETKKSAKDINDAMDGVKEGAKETKNNFSDMFSNIAGSFSGMKDTFGNVKDIFKNMGSNVSEGFMGGIDGIKDKFKGFFKKNVGDQAADDLDIHSPSKLFKRFGYYTMLGYEQGIIEKQDEVQKIVKESLKFDGKNFWKDGKIISEEYIDKYNAEVDKINSNIRDNNKKIDEYLNLEKNRGLIDSYVNLFSDLNWGGYLKMDEEQISTLPEELQTEIKAMKDFIQGVDTNDSNILAKLGFNPEEIGTVIKYREEIIETMNGISESQKAIKPFSGILLALGLNETVQKDIQKWFDKVKNMFELLPATLFGIDIFGAVFKTQDTSILEHMEVMRSIFDDFKTFLFDNVFKPLIESGKNIIFSLMNIFSSIGDVIYTLISTITAPFQYLGQIFTSFFGNSEKKIRQMKTKTQGLNSVIEVLAKILSFIGKILTTVLITPIVNIINITSKIILIITNIIKTITSLIKLGITAYITNIKNIIQNIINFITNIPKKISTVTNSVTEMHPALKAIVDFFKGIINFGKQVIDVVGNVAGAIGNAIKSIIDGIVGFLVNNPVTKFLISLFNGDFAKELDNLEKDLKNKDFGVASKMSDDTEKSRNKIKDALENGYDLNEEYKRISTESGEEAANNFIMSEIDALSGEDSVLKEAVYKKWKEAIENTEGNVDPSNIVKLAYEEAKKEMDAQEKQLEHYKEKANDTYKKLQEKYGEEVAEAYIKSEVAKITDDKDQQKAIIDQFHNNNNTYGNLLDDAYKKYLSKNQDVVNEAIDQFKADNYKDILNTAGEETADAYLLAEAAKITSDKSVQQAILKKFKESQKEQSELEKIRDDVLKERKEKEEKALKAHRSYLSNYKQDMDTEKRIVKFYAEEQKKIFEQNVKDKKEGYTQELLDRTDFTGQAQTAWDNYLSQLATQFMAEDELFKDKIANLDENLSEEERLRAINLEALKHYQEKYNITNSGFDWGSASPTKKFEQKSSEVKSHEAIDNMKSYLGAYTAFQQDMIRLAGFNVPTEFLSALYADGPNGDLFLAAKNMGDNMLEEFSKVWTDIDTFKKTGDSAWFTANIVARRQELQAAHVRNDNELGSKENPYIIGKKKYYKKETGLEEIKDDEDKDNEISEDDQIQSEIDKYTGPAALQQQTQNAQQFGSNIVSSISDGINSALPTLEQSVALMESSINKIGPDAEKEAPILTQMAELDSKVTTVEEALKKVVEEVTKLANSILNSGASSVLEGQGINLAQGLANGIKIGTDRVRNSIREMCNNAIQTAKSTFGIASPSKVFYEFGDNIIEGLCNSIENGGSRVANAMVNEVLKKMHDDAEDEEEINSPSKRWYLFGSYIDQGLANGISDNVKSPISALGELLSGISEDMEMDEEYNPVITPVLDLSEAKKQSKSISSLIGNQNALSISAEMSYSKLHQNEGQNNGPSSQGKTFNFTQNNYSPKELSRLEIYRQTNNQFSQIKTLLDK